MSPSPIEVPELWVWELVAISSLAALVLFLLYHALRRRSERLTAQAQVLELNASLERQVRERTQQLEAAGLLQRAMLTSAGYGIVATDAAGTITLFNPAAERMLGYSAQELVGLHEPAIFFDPVEVAERSSRLSARIGRDLDPGVESIIASVERLGAFEEEWTFLRKDGSRVPVLANVTALRDSEGRLTGLLGIVIDRTEIKRSQSELQRAKEAADAASQAKGMFLANMSHEIRTPMNAVLGMLQLLHRTQLSGRQVDYLAKASSAARSMLELIDEVLDLSKIEAGKLSLEPRSFQVDELLRDTAPLLTTSIGDKPVEVLFNVSPDLPKALEGDLLRLKQVLVNLGGNAIKFTAQGNVLLSVDVDRIERDRVFVRFCVEDTGIGMSPEQQQRVFQPFTQAEVGTTRRYGGTGLGLAISQRLVELMGGELRLESEIGRGTKFWFVVGLGRAGSATESPSKPGDGPLAEGLQSLRTLVVDDDDLVRTVLGRLAISLGWEADLCASGAEAVHRFEQSLESGRPYELALIDWRMPELDGWQTAGLIRSVQRPGAPLAIVMVTGHAEEMLDSTVDQDPTRIDAVLVKPITRSDLLEAATRALRGSASDCGRQHSQGHESARQLAGLRLLVVEDNPINQQVARELLADEGAEVEVVASGRSAIERLRIDPSRCDAILMDIQMPRLDGYDTTRQIRNELGLKDLPILAMTANVMATDRELALAAGMNDHIGKPFEVDEVVERVLALCRRGRRPVAPRANSEAEPSQGIHLDSMPEIEGFGLHRALQRIAYKGELFSRLVRVFVSEFEGEGKTLSALVQQSDFAAACNRLHTLRGVAANLGAEALAAAASDLEVAIKDRRNPAELQRRSGTLASRLAEACATLAGVADKLDASSAPLARQDAGDVGDAGDLGAASTQLQDLECYLADSNMHAVEVHAQLRPYLSDLHGEAASELASELDAAMNQLDFQTAFLRVHDLLDLASRSPIQAGPDASEPSSFGATP